MMIQSYRMYSTSERLRIVVQLSKMRISQLVALSTMVGYILATGELSLFMLVPTLGTFLLSCGSSALNQYQERGYDALMERTSDRPIPAGRISAGEGLVIAILLMLAGAAVLLLGTNITALMLGLFNVLWYNGVYTPLKRVSALAVVPGSLIGAIPPAIGWAAGGGSLLDGQILAVGLFFFVWQIPHFWLLLLNLSKDYERAGFPTLTRRLSDRQLARITFFLTLATIAACLMLPFFGVGDSLLLYAALLLSAAWLAWDSRKLLSQTLSRHLFKSRFMAINIYMLLVMLFFSLDRLIG